MVAVGSRSLDKAAAFIEETGLKATAMAFGSYEEVIADPRVQAVYMPLPAGLHVEWVKKACDHGKHILLEKPIALVRCKPSSASATIQKPDLASCQASGTGQLCAADRLAEILCLSTFKREVQLSLDFMLRCM